MTSFLQPRWGDGMAGRTLGLALYRAAWSVLGFAAEPVLERRAARGKEDPTRRNERLGRPTQERPFGQLVWIHGASVGECLAVLPLISRLLAKADRHIMVTSGTVTSAQLMAKRLPMRAFHQYVPVDSPSAVTRFLEHWRPDAALFVESEFWPNLVLETRAKGIPLALINARFSERAFRGWQRARGTAAALVSAFDVALAQDNVTVKRLTALGARDVRVAGSLKADTPPLPADEAALKAFQGAVAGRPLFLAASTHPREDEQVLDAATMIRAVRAETLTVIVPRHPERGAAIESLARTRALLVARRSEGTLPGRAKAVYVADTLGELGLFYRAAPFAFLGGSLIPHGGQNPYEPAQLGVAILTGPHTENFAESFRAILTKQGEGCVHSAEELATEALKLLKDPGLAARLGAAARAAAETQAGALERTHEAVEALLASHAHS
ncbi:MAG: 3-deoxy-D-manno-octulosonic acid transferase [Alphaproteobacteria bacterium]